MAKIEEQPREIWLNILNSVANSKATATKNILLLGEPNSGKTSLINYFKIDNILKEVENSEDFDSKLGGTPLPILHQSENDFDKQNLPERGATECGSASIGADGSLLRQNQSGGRTAPLLEETKSIQNNLGLTYEFVDLKDELEEIIGRLNFFELSDTNAEFHKLLDLALNLNNFQSTLVCIFLDWSNPWSFVRILQKWLTCLEVAIYNIQERGGHPTEENLNGIKVDSNGSANRSSEHSDLLPPGNGCLTMNLGIPIIVICSKSDQMKVIEREGNYKEEEFDFIQQTLRTTCLHYGASLFYTSNQSKASLILLKNYILSKSFPTVDNISILPNHILNFNFKAQVVDREKVFVPAGWDSWNKIRVLRDSFNCEGVLQGMEFDLSHERSKYLPYVEAELNHDTDEIMSINEYYYSIVKIPFSKDQRSQNGEAPIEAYSEQKFLEEQFNTILNTTDSSNTKVNGNLGYVGTLGKLHTPSLNQTTRNNNNATNNKLSISTTEPVLPIAAESASQTPVEPQNAERLSNFFGDFLKKGVKN
ncbi:DLIC-domain-containing protein [Conidiobolus coronatus NRRL 28638]|uniref:DLIC-domain-containing protein n=1 Tax=Conidiobolus coronatus (strain ATCC 28846 / CBS 209.66 / NRRL 28638) TaxID=796925 RepID=A0A137P3G0_CONC2|nr:DLIC-domain-containing protein [Conidiobolus coronatus NRRL 28638]|eukprot:KXN69553.1 DLIC-domain-containing protein [Conidiobolus coronatus NRRL 28638]